MDEPRREDIVALLRARFALVLARPETDIAETDAFDEDLEADSLDLVEVIEGVEGDLAARGAVVNISEDELLALRTVGGAADCLHAHVRAARGDER